MGLSFKSLSWVMIVTISVTSLVDASKIRHTLQQFGSWFSLKHPNDCGSDCIYQLDWMPNGDVIDFRLHGKTNHNGSGYIAMGLSPDSKMGLDSVIHCAMLNGSVEVAASWNTINPFGNVLMSNPSLGLTNISAVAFNTTIDCNFTREMKVNDPKVYHIDEHQVIFFAHGEVATIDTNYRLKKHDKDFYSDRKYKLSAPLENPPEPQTTATTTMKTTTAPKTKEKWPIKLHGTFMSIAWIGAVPLGVTISTSFRLIGGNGKIFGKRSWFAAHAASMITALLFTVAGFVLSMKYESWELELEKLHTVSGFITFLLVIVQAIMGLMRPGPSSNLRFTFNLVHAIFGLCLWLLGIIALISGFIYLFSSGGKREMTPMQESCVAIVGIFEVGLLLYILIRQVQNRLINGEKKERENGILSQEDLAEAKKERWPLIFLGIVTLFVLFYGIFCGWFA